jgi:hypothetical protein
MDDEHAPWLERLSRIVAWIAVVLFGAMVWLVLCRLAICRAAPPAP